MTIALSHRARPPIVEVQVVRLAVLEHVRLACDDLLPLRHRIVASAGIVVRQRAGAVPPTPPANQTRARTRQSLKTDAEPG